MSSLPTPLRAALGVALTVVDTARETATSLPQKAAGLPVAVVSQAVQVSLRAQQQYAAYVNKGDELIGAFRGAPEEPPAWATFDEDEPTPARNTAFDRVPDAEDELDEVQALEEIEDLAEVLAEESGESRLDAALDVLDGSYEAADGPRPTPGAPATTASDAEVTPLPGGDEIIGADAPRTTASREPARKATRKIATKASRKTAAKAPAKAAKKAPAKKTPPTTSVGETAGLPSSPPPAKKAAKKAAKKVAPAADAPGTAPAKKAATKAAKKAPAKKAAPLPDATLPLEELPAPAITPPPAPEPTVGDGEPTGAGS